MFVALPLCPCEWEGWVLGQRPGWFQPRSAHGARETSRFGPSNCRRIGRAEPVGSSGLHQISSERSSWKLRLPLLVCEARCECGLSFDGHGRHRAACPHSGRLSLSTRTHTRQSVRGAGASVRFNAKLVDMNIAVPADDARAVEVLASGLPLFHGAQLAVDITLRSALTTTGLLRPGAAVVDGIVCMAARADKERKSSELLNGDKCRLVVFALETGGPWSLEAVDFIERLAMARAWDAPPNLQRSAFLSWRRHWTRMITISLPTRWPSPLTLTHLPVLMGECPIWLRSSRKSDMSDFG